MKIMRMRMPMRIFHQSNPAHDEEEEDSQDNEDDGDEESQGNDEGQTHIVFMLIICAHCSKAP